MQGNIAECKGQPQTTKNCLAPNVKSAEVEKPVIRRKSECKSLESSCLSTRYDCNEHGENITFGNWQGSRVGKTSMNTAHVFTRTFIKKIQMFFSLLPQMVDRAQNTYFVHSQPCRQRATLHYSDKLGKSHDASCFMVRFSLS